MTDDCDHRTRKTNRETGAITCLACGKRIAVASGAEIPKMVEQKLLEDLW